MNKKAKEHLKQFLVEVELRGMVIGGLITALIFDFGLFIGIVWGNH